jgi:hypothetical protein
MFDHRHLVGDRAVEAHPTHGAGAPHGIAQFLGRHFAIDVTAVEAVMAVGRLDHRHRRVLRRRHGEGAGELAQEIHLGHVGPPVNAADAITGPSAFTSGGD